MDDRPKSTHCVHVVYFSRKDHAPCLPVENRVLKNRFAGTVCFLFQVQLVSPQCHPNLDCPGNLLLHIKENIQEMSEARLGLTKSLDIFWESVN